MLLDNLAANSNGKKWTWTFEFSSEIMTANYGGRSEINMFYFFSYIP